MAKAGNSKGKFYRLLQLDKTTKETITIYNKLKKSMMAEKKQ